MIMNIPVRALRTITEFVPCVVVTDVHNGCVRVCASEKRNVQNLCDVRFRPKSIKKKGSTIVGRVDMPTESTTSMENKYKFAIWMGLRHGWVIAPGSDTYDHVLLRKISDDEFSVTLGYSHMLYTWNGREFAATAVPHPLQNWKPWCPTWYALTPLPARSHVVDYFKCNTDIILINMPVAHVHGNTRFFSHQSPQFAPALFDTKTQAVRPMKCKTPEDMPHEYMVIMGCVQRSESTLQFLLCSYGDPYRPYREHVSIMSIDVQELSSPTPSFTLLATPLKIRQMRAVQCFLIHHLSDYNVFVGRSNGCLCLLTHDPAAHVLSVHYQSTCGTWNFDVHQIGLPEEKDVDKISVSLHRVHLFVDSEVFYSDFALDPPRHTPFVKLEGVDLDYGTLDVELRDGRGILDWIAYEMRSKPSNRNA